MPMNGAAAENETLDRAELAYDMAGRRGDWAAQASAHRVMSAAAGRLDRLEARREAQAVYEAERKAEEIRQAIKAMIQDADPN
jgi:hypothetical protein